VRQPPILLLLVHRRLEVPGQPRHDLFDGADGRQMFEQKAQVRLRLDGIAAEAPVSNIHAGSAVTLSHCKEVFSG